MSRRALVALFAMACAGAPDGDDGVTDDTVDLRRDFPEPPAGALVIYSPEYVVPAYSERQFCTFDTYRGPTIGITAQQTYQSPNGHHVTLNIATASEREVPDGTMVDCTAADSLPMSDLDPLLIGGGVFPDDDGVSGGMVLPAGMAAQLKEGQRTIVQSHYVNTTGDDIRVHDAIYIEHIAPEEVETWAAPWVHVVTEHPIPAGAMGYNLTFDCTWEQEANLLFLGGHMHEWGWAFETRMTPMDGSGERSLYAVPDWLPEMRDAPVYEEYGQDEFKVVPGDVFTTSCTWNNTTDHTLDFPEEMCVTFGMAYPAKVPIICSPD